MQLPPLGTVNRIVVKPDAANPPDGPFDLRIVSTLDVDRTLGQVQAIDNTATSTHYPFVPGAAPDRHAPLALRRPTELIIENAGRNRQGLVCVYCSS